MKGRKRSSSSLSAADRAAAAAAAELWTTNLASPPPAPPSRARGSSELLRRLGIAKLVHDIWTSPSNGCEAGAAEKWLIDGSVDALEDFVSTAATEADGNFNAFEIVRDGAELNSLNGRSALFAASKLLPGPSQRPALLVGAAEGWRCSQLWKKEKSAPSPSTLTGSSSCSLPPPSPPSPPSAPNWCAFASSFPDGEMGRLSDGRRRGGGPDSRKRVEVTEAVELIERSSAARDAAVGAGGDPAPGALDRPLPYLKDLQCSQAHPRGFLDDARPSWACGDEWLGEGADSWKGDGENGDPARRRPPSYRFVYAGPRGASTPWHCDVYGSCAWSANVAGWKRWTFLSPSDAPLLYSRFGERTAKWFGDDGGSDDGVSFPWLDEARSRSFTLLQGPSDVVFVPPAWWHCVENVAPPSTAAEKSIGGDDDEQRRQQQGQRQGEQRDLGSISINVNFISGPIACAVAWEDSVLREHEEVLRKMMGDDGSDDVGFSKGGEKVLSRPLPPLPPLPARQVDGTTLASSSSIEDSVRTSSALAESAQGIGIGGFVALALGAADRAAAAVTASASMDEKENDKDNEDSEASLLLSRVALARAAVSARSARAVLVGAASFARGAAACARFRRRHDESDESEEDEREVASRFLEGLTLSEVEAAAERARKTVEAAAEVLGVVPQFDGEK